MSRRKVEDGAVGAASGFAGARHAAKEALATDRLRSGLDLYRAAAERLKAVEPRFRRGNLLEYVESAKFNAAAARKSSQALSEVTAANGDPTGPADILIRRGGKVVKAVQSKASRSTPSLVRELSQKKYSGMQKLVPSEMEGRVRETSAKLAPRYEARGDARAADLRDTARKTTGELRHGKVRSGGTSNAELDAATSAPGRYALGKNLAQVGREAGKAALGGAVAGGIMGGAISSVRNGMAAWRGELKPGEAAGRVAKDAANSAANGAAVAATGAVVRTVAERAGLSALAKTNVATGIAAGLIDATATLVAYAKGEIDGQVVAERLGETAVCTTGSIYAGAVAGSVLGPPGAVVGAVAGYLVATFTYQGCLALRREAQLATEEADRLEALTNEAVAALRASTQELQAAIAAAIEKRDRQLGGGMSSIEAGLESGQVGEVVEGLSLFVAHLGHRLGFESFGEFDQFMVEGTEPLRL